MVTGKNPQTPPGPLVRDRSDTIVLRSPLWRIHRSRGTHVLAWNALRIFGPLAGLRWDPHPPPCAEHPAFGVSYAALDVATCVAEVFQTRRLIRADDSVHLTSWTPTRDLQLLDLTGGWALRNGASYSLHAAPKSTCRAWANAIRKTWPDLDGLYVPSTLTGAPNVVLFDASRDSFPAAPAFSRPLGSPAVFDVLDRIAARLGYRLRP